MRISQLQPGTPEQTAQALRAHFARHNLRVLGFSAVTLFAAVALWASVYAVCGWLILLAEAAVDLPQVGLPPRFNLVFLSAGLSAILLAWLLRRWHPHEFPRDDKKMWEHGVDFLLAIPRITLAVGGTLAAWQRLRAEEISLAVGLLQRLAQVRALSLQSVPIEIPDDRTRAKILFALQLTRVIELRRRGREWSVTLHSQRPRALRLA